MESALRKYIDKKEMDAKDDKILKSIEKKETLCVEELIILNNIHEKNNMKKHFLKHLLNKEEKISEEDKDMLEILEGKRIFIAQILHKNKEKRCFFEVLKEIIKLNPNNFTEYDFALLDGVVNIISNRQYALSKSLNSENKGTQDTKEYLEQNLKDIENLKRIFEDLVNYKIWNDRPDKISGLTIHRDRLNTLKFVDSYLKKYKGKLTLL